MSLQALVWDVDGTLVENEELHRAAFNAAFAAAGLPWHWDTERYRGLLQVAGGRERIAHFIAGSEPARTRERGYATFLRELHADKTRRYGELLAHGELSPRPGVVRLITAARAAGLRQAIATSTRRVNVDRLLGRLLGPRLAATFTVIASGDQVAAMKPAPDLYRVALAGLGLPAAAALAIEDSAIGLAAARAAGLPTVVTMSRYCSGEPFAGALAVVDSLGEPDAPCHGLTGDLHGRACVDLDLLRRWHATA